MRDSSNIKDASTIALTIKQMAKSQLRNKVQEMIEKEMKSIVRDLTDQFIEEFKPQVTSYLERDSHSFLDRAVVEIKVKGLE